MATTTLLDLDVDRLSLDRLTIYAGKCLAVYVAIHVFLTGNAVGPLGFRCSITGTEQPNRMQRLSPLAVCRESMFFSAVRSHSIYDVPQVSRLKEAELGDQRLEAPEPSTTSPLHITENQIDDVVEPLHEDFYGARNASQVPSSLHIEQRVLQCQAEHMQ
ncbi:hypothetical protein CMQ_5382 [Grosmannia clavigera kw1407]|uniref:Uncharacterized protein n=1 Tax=Grosmannia clavigera (strain kw1407 / UAMH 11150) TaxID=655863 RepID=F0XB44_GROCL|nr:uncharacterized protein CMQ_5382 [Grosmannia clavigera kw1407]EFX05120.1 hypothetical protein CMQ_5382 [Grosmannia clavigera kw1407]